MAIRNILTTLWPIVQAGTDSEALNVWQDIWDLLELDADSWMDLMLLAHQGPVGRNEANKLLWTLLTIYGTNGEHRNLSRKVSSLINGIRKTIDRPPSSHPDVKVPPGLRGSSRWHIQRNQS